ncbi:MAG TPA: PRC-barrel domain-containing protein [Leptolyngbyaceae cyanobacterium M33_DOE_097]|uniref:PRC-barrel domain-containing protein n=1 Tax=Oscillatoriales cyanobacterium SpSt-418 TaxID=2282169 RepID=A0A7C3KIJ7_9CYAN|nr:PRC-barrel domain-containing protein [Leptolyngbyaceae cyanobacterium M33_DOE_097]
MPSSTGPLKHSDLINRLVIDRASMENVGRVEVLWMYPPAHKVLGFVCKSGLLGSKKTAFNLMQIYTLGENSILVGSAGQETDGDRVNQLESLIGCEVWSDAGGKAGKIIDYVFDGKTGQISAYLFTTDGRLSALTEGIFQLVPSQILNIGRQRILISDISARSLVPYKEGIRRRIAKVGDTLLEEYRDVTSKAQTAAEQAKRRVQDLTEQAKEVAQNLGEQLVESTQNLTEQAIETSHSLADQVRHQAEVLTDQLQDEPVKSGETAKPETENLELDDWLAEPSDRPEPVPLTPLGEKQSESEPSAPLPDEAADLWSVEPDRPPLDLPAPPAKKTSDWQPAVTSPATETSDDDPWGVEAAEVDRTAPVESAAPPAPPPVDFEDDWDVETPPATPTEVQPPEPIAVIEFDELGDIWDDEDPLPTSEDPSQR